MKVLSLFNGMGCIWIALDRLGIKVEKRYISEIDKYANIVNNHNYPDSIQLGDVTKVNGRDLPKIDLVVGGSPCQGFSFAGKGLNFEDPRSKLFFEFVRLVKECKPKYFLLENVKMKKEHELVISNYLGVAPIEINSSLVSAQSRKRLYWTNIYNKPFGLLGDMYCAIPQPEDKGILLKDILQTDVSEKYFLKESQLDWWNKNKEFQLQKGYSSLDSEKGITQTARQYASWNGNYVSCVAMRGRNPENPKSRESGLHTEQMLEERTDEKTNTLTSVQKDNLIFQLPHGTNKGGFVDNKGKCPSMTKSAWEHNNILNAIRRLTPVECCRLQTVPDSYFYDKDGKNIISDSQIYKCLGNGWTVDVIAHILSYMKF